ncbi:hypothetical protein ACHQM5_022107 [Ranunculus cassubicifolius]
MGFSEKLQVDGGLDTEGKKWVVSGIQVRGPLRRINTKELKIEEEEENLTTPTAEDVKIPEKLKCPPPPRKRRVSSKCNFNGVRDFFNPPDLESVFVRQ